MKLLLISLYCWGWPIHQISVAAADIRPIVVVPVPSEHQQQRTPNKLDSQNVYTNLIRSRLLHPQVRRVAPWFEFLKPLYGTILSTPSTQVHFALGGFVVPHDGTLIFSTHKAGAKDIEIASGLNCSRIPNSAGQCEGVLT
jgi:hypothetical protein